MRRFLGGLAIVLVASSLAAARLEAHPASAAATSGTVAYVVDGDTLDVRLDGGRHERVRLIGIDTPERGACYAAKASARARLVALGRRVVLHPDPTQDRRDRYGRLLAYASIGGEDLGYRLIAGGFGRTYVYRDPFQRLASYVAAERRAKSEKLGLWSACAAGGGTNTSGSCHPSYSPCLPVVADLDCADVRAMGKAPVRVLGSDPYRLDGDGDGLGCE